MESVGIEIEFNFLIFFYYALDNSANNDGFQSFEWQVSMFTHLYFPKIHHYATPVWTWAD